MKKQNYKILAVLLCASMVFSIGCSKEITTSVSEEPVSSVEEKKEDTSKESKENTEQKTENSTSVDADAIVKVSVKFKEVPESETMAFVKDMGAGFNLGNTFDSNDTNNNGKSDLSYETLWGNPVTTKQNIVDLKEAGFRTIRIPVSWHNHVDEDFNINQEWMDRVEEVVKWALEEDMYVILNIHHDNMKKYMYPSYETLDNSKKYVSKIWSQIATRFGDYGEKLIFEGLNEPRQSGTSNEWSITVSSDIGQECIDCVNQLNQIIVDTIRETPGEYNKSRFISVPGYCASPDYVLCEDFIIPDDSKCEKENRILITVHAYKPYGFALAESNNSEVTDKFSTIGSGKEIETMCMQLYLKFVKNDIGVIIDEFGARDRNKNTQARTNYAACFPAYARACNIPCCWWDNGCFSGTGEIFGIYRRSNNTFEYPSIVKQLTYYGNYE